MKLLYLFIILLLLSCNKIDEYPDLTDFRGKWVSGDILIEFTDSNLNILTSDTNLNDLCYSFVAGNLGIFDCDPQFHYNNYTSHDWYIDNKKDKLFIFNLNYRGLKIKPFEYTSFNRFR